MQVWQNARTGHSDPARAAGATAAYSVSSYSEKVRQRTVGRLEPGFLTSPSSRLALYPLQVPMSKFEEGEYLNTRYKAIEERLAVRA